MTKNVDNSSKVYNSEIKRTIWLIFTDNGFYRGFSGDMCPKSIVNADVRTRISASSGPNELGKKS